MKTKLKKFGFEIEGEFSEDLMEKLAKYGEIKTDGSINRCRNCNLSGMEFASRPLAINSYGRKQLKEIFSLLEEKHKEKEFHWNKSCGFHVHVSFSPNQPPEIWSKEFTNGFLQVMGQKFPGILKRRSNNRYCKATSYRDIDIVDSQDRYRFINLNSAYDSHGTIEFRIFPSGNPKNLRKYLVFILKFVRMFIANGIEKTLEVELADDSQEIELNESFLSGLSGENRELEINY